MVCTKDRSSLPACWLMSGCAQVLLADTTGLEIAVLHGGIVKISWCCPRVCWSWHWLVCLGVLVLSMLWSTPWAWQIPEKPVCSCSPLVQLWLTRAPKGARTGTLAGHLCWGSPAPCVSAGWPRWLGYFCMSSLHKEQTLGKTMAIG